MNRKYGKSSKDIMKFKQNFLESNEHLLETNNNIAKIYLQQPKREKCKLCNQKLMKSKTFESHNITYIHCENCGHINGERIETDEFTEKLFLDSEYDEFYLEVNKERYYDRVDSIYKPKLEFLIESLKVDGLDKDYIRLLDIGAGSGYLISAAVDMNIVSEGIEISEKQVNYANTVNEKELLRLKQKNDLVNEINKTKANVVSAIGVFVHLVQLKEVLEAIRDNDNIEYLYICVPLFSYSCILESVEKDIFNRHLGGGHTNLFTQESLKWLAEHYGMEIISKWQFGSDAMDLYRMLSVKLEQTNNTLLKSCLEEKLLPLIDDIQLVFDRSDFSSEIHMLLKKR